MAIPQPIDGPADGADFLFDIVNHIRAKDAHDGDSVQTATLDRPFCTLQGGNGKIGQGDQLAPMGVIQSADLAVLDIEHAKHFAGAGSASLPPLAAGATINSTRIARIP